MEVSILLAKLFGLYLLIVSIAILNQYKDYTEMAKKFIKIVPLVYFVADFELLLGLLLVLVHNVWVFDWRVIITILSWLIFIEGVLYTFFPKTFLPITKKMSSKTSYIIACVLSLVLGGYLTYVGFFVAS